MSADVSIERLRRIGPGLLAALVEAGREALGESALDEWLLPVIADCGWLYAALDGDEIVGAAEVIRRRDDDELYLEGLYIRPGYQGRGLGGTLLSAVMDSLAEEGYTRILTTLDPGNDTAAALYRGHGFTRLETLPDRYGPGRDRYLLAAPLGGDADG